MKRYSIAVLVLASVLFATICMAGPAKPPEKTRIAVLNLTMERGLDEGLVKLLNELLMTEFQRSGKYEVIGGSDIEGMLVLEQKKQMMNCTDASCLAEIGGALGVEKLVIGSIGKVGSLYLVNVKIIDIRNANVDARVSYQVEGIEDKLVRAITNSVNELITGERPGDSKTISAAGKVAGKLETPRHPYNLWGHVTLWSGVGCAAFGLAALFLAKSAGDDYNASGSTEDYDSSNMWTGIMWTGFSLGAALMATGAALWLLEPDGDGSAQATASVGPTLDGQGMVFSVTGRW